MRQPIYFGNRKKLRTIPAKLDLADSYVPYPIRPPRCRGPRDDLPFRLHDSQPRSVSAKAIQSRDRSGEQYGQQQRRSGSGFRKPGNASSISADASFSDFPLRGWPNRSRSMVISPDGSPAFRSRPASPPE
jgi:hypothetical protein